MSVTTTAPVAKANLFALIQASANFAGVGVTWAHPGSETQQESVFFGDTVWKDEWSEVMSPARKRDETYRIEVVIRVAYDGDDGKATEDRMWTLVGALETVVHSQPSLSTATPDDGNGPLLWCGCKPQGQATTTIPGQRVSVFIMEIECRARK